MPNELRKKHYYNILGDTENSSSVISSADLQVSSQTQKDDGDVAETTKGCTEERPDQLSIEVTSPEGTTRPHKTPEPHTQATSEVRKLDVVIK